MKSLQKINNLGDLQAEIAHLRLRRNEQEAYLGDQYKLLRAKIDTPFRLIRRITSHVPGVGMLKGLTSGIGKAVESKDADWLTRLLRIGAPVVLNSTLLRKAGWFKKAMVLLASETAIGQVNQDRISGLVDKITTFIKPKKKKSKKKKEDKIEEQPVIDQLSILEDERYAEV